MYYVLLLLKIIVSISLLNVWFIQKDKATKWRGGNAKNLMEEFKAYGLSESMFYFVGFLKVGLSLILIASIWVSSLENYSALGLIILLSGSIVMHFKISDPLYKSFPAFLFLVFCALIFMF
jgi:preprotein translocase subunit SecG